VACVDDFSDSAREWRRVVGANFGYDLMNGFHFYGILYYSDWIRVI